MWVIVDDDGALISTRAWISEEDAKAAMKAMEYGDFYELEELELIE